MPNFPVTKFALIVTKISCTFAWVIVVRCVSKETLFLTMSLNPCLVPMVVSYLVCIFKSSNTLGQSTFRCPFTSVAVGLTPEQNKYVINIQLIIVIILLTLILFQNFYHTDFNCHHNNNNNINALRMSSIFHLLSSYKVFMRTCGRGRPTLDCYGTVENIAVLGPRIHSADLDVIHMSIS